MKKKTRRVHSSKLNDAAKARLVKAICEWFGAHARKLPWRARRSGYSALVAEAMLQQTQAARVVDFYRAFMKRFPTVQSLAQAHEQDVLAHWQGLGYYRRARNLHQAARMIVEQFNGMVPSDASDLQRLPGVGRYTAGAIASIVFGRREPIVDGNVQRVLARWYARRTPADSKSSVNWTWRQAEELVRAAARPGIFNEALMELGATVCKPAAPKCGVCPVAKLCEARRRNVEDQIPLPKRRAKPAPLAVHHHAVLISRNGRVLVEQRAGGMWAGMWQAPTIESAAPMSLVEIKAALKIPVERLEDCGGFVHKTTHRRIMFRVLRARSRVRRGVWRSPDDLNDLPMSNAQKRVLEML